MQFDGELNNVSIPNLMQLIKSGGLTGKMSISDEANQALIWFEKGDIVQVESGQQQGREALMALFLWQSGHFSFSEQGLEGVVRTFDPAKVSDAIEALIREGISHADQKAAFDRLNIQKDSLLKCKVDLAQVPDGDVKNLLGFLDGSTSLAQALRKAELMGGVSLEAVNAAVNKGMVDILPKGTAAAPAAQPAPTGRTTSINLPDWVRARLRQDNQDLSQAIVDMVIWVDRVKCWMYQADADLEAVIKNMAACQKQNDQTESTVDK